MLFFQLSDGLEILPFGSASQKAAKHQLITRYILIHWGVIKKKAKNKTKLVHPCVLWIVTLVYKI